MELPDPGLLVPIVAEDLNDAHDEGSLRPCSAIEFDATFFYDECSRYQKDYGALCCGGEPSMTSASNEVRNTASLIIFSCITAAWNHFFN
jgi:hypothetical protein